MVVTAIEPVTTKKCAVFLDGEFAFVLYKGELHKYEIIRDQELSEENYSEIMETLLPKRAKLRCMNLLKSRPYTRKQLQDKLRMGRYPASVAEAALAYVEDYGYVDDAAYARSYIQDYLDRKSRRRLEEDLAGKGIARELIEQAFDEVQALDGLQDEERQILELLERKHYRPQEADLKEKRRLQAFLYRRGFSPEKIRKAMNCEDFGGESGWTE